MIRVPAVLGLARLILAIRLLLPLQPVMLDIIGKAQLLPGIEIVDQKKRDHDPAEKNDHSRRQH